MEQCSTKGRNSEKREDLVVNDLVSHAEETEFDPQVKFSEATEEA